MVFSKMYAYVVALLLASHSVATTAQLFSLLPKSGCAQIESSSILANVRIIREVSCTKSKLFHGRTCTYEAETLDIYKNENSKRSLPFPTSPEAAKFQFVATNVRKLFYHFDSNKNYLVKFYVGQDNEFRSELYCESSG
jgi:hypothetical protein